MDIRPPVRDAFRAVQARGGSPTLEAVNQQLGGAVAATAEEVLALALEALESRRPSGPSPSAATFQTGQAVPLALRLKTPTASPFDPATVARIEGLGPLPDVAPTGSLVSDGQLRLIWSDLDDARRKVRSRDPQQKAAGLAAAKQLLPDLMAVHAGAEARADDAGLKVRWNAGAMIQRVLLLEPSALPDPPASLGLDLGLVGNSLPAAQEVQRDVRLAAYFCQTPDLAAFALSHAETSLRANWKHLSESDGGVVLASLHELAALQRHAGRDAAADASRQLADLVRPGFTRRDPAEVQALLGAISRAAPAQFSALLTLAGLADVRYFGSGAYTDTTAAALVSQVLRREVPKYTLIIASDTPPERVAQLPSSCEEGGVSGGLLLRFVRQEGSALIPVGYGMADRPDVWVSHEEVRTARRADSDENPG